MSVWTKFMSEKFSEKPPVTSNVRLPDEVSPTSIDNTEFDEPCIDRQELVDAIKSMKRNRAVGHDLVPVEVYLYSEKAQD